MASPFDVLRIDPDADEEEIQRAYRQRVIEAHPDHGGTTSEFQRVRMAYAKLKAGYSIEDDSDEYAVEDEEQENSQVEYLNYEVLDDHGWNVDDESLFEKASEANLDASDYGKFLVHSHESLLEAAENRGFAWPYACRGGACANCAVAVMEGEMDMPVNNILPPEMTDRGIRLSCNGTPVTDEMKVIYNLKHLPDLEELRLPPRPFEQAYASD